MIRFPPAHLSDCELVFGCTAFHCHRLLLWHTCTALRPLLAAPPSTACQQQALIAEREAVAAELIARRPRRARKPSFSTLTPRWIITDVEEDEDEDEEESGEVAQDKHPASEANVLTWSKRQQQQQQADAEQLQSDKQQSSVEAVGTAHRPASSIGR